MRAQLSMEAAQSLPLFKVLADTGTHPPVALDRAVCLIGRKEGANLPLPSQQVSKVHAFIVREQGRVYLRDLASTNGVQRNGTPVQEVGLSDADIIRVGTFTLRCASGFGREEAEEVTSDDTHADIAPAAEIRTPEAVFPLPADRHTMLIGQRAACDIRLNDRHVAPVHAIIFELDGKRFIQNLTNSGVTELNGRRIHREELHAGDKLKVGKTQLRYALAEIEHVIEGEIEPEPQTASDSFVESSYELSSESGIPINTSGESGIEAAMGSATEPNIEPLSDQSAELTPTEEPEPVPAPDAAAESSGESLIEPVIDSAAESHVDEGMQVEAEPPAPEQAAEEPPPDISAPSPTAETIEPAEEAEEWDVEAAPEESKEDSLIPLEEVGPTEPAAAPAPAPQPEASKPEPERPTDGPLPRAEQQGGPAAESQNGKRTEEQITTLVEAVAEKAETLREVAEKAEALKEAWSEYSSSDWPPVEPPSESSDLIEPQS